MYEIEMEAECIFYKSCTSASHLRKKTPMIENVDGTSAGWEKICIGVRGEDARMKADGKKTGASARRKAKSKPMQVRRGQVEKRNPARSSARSFIPFALSG